MPRYTKKDANGKYYIESANGKLESNIKGHTYGEAIERFAELENADVVPKSEDGAECPTCNGTGRIGTTDWLIKNISKKQLAKEKAEAIAEHELHIKQDYAREIFEKFKAEMHSRINSCDRLYREDPDDFYGGQVWAYSAAIFVFENLLKEITDENTR